MEQVNLLKEEILVKDSKLIILEARVANKEEEARSWERSLVTSNTQLAVSQAQTKEVRQQNTLLKDENKQLRKKGRIKSIGLVALTILCVISIATN